MNIAEQIKFEVLKSLDHTDYPELFKFDVPDDFLEKEAEYAKFFAPYVCDLTHSNYFFTTIKKKFKEYKGQTLVFEQLGIFATFYEEGDGSYYDSAVTETLYTLNRFELELEHRGEEIQKLYQRVSNKFMD